MELTNESKTKDTRKSPPLLVNRDSGLVKPLCHIASYLEQAYYDAETQTNKQAHKQLSFFIHEYFGLALQPAETG